MYKNCKFLKQNSTYKKKQNRYNFLTIFLKDIKITSAGKKFREALKASSPLQIVGTINAYQALQATKVGHKAIYLSGGGIANASYGLPDLGMTMIEDVCIDIRRVTSICDTPLIVDADTGWGHAFNVARTVKEFIRSGAAGMHIEDQVAAKRCGHRPNKELVSTEEMCDRIRAAVDAKKELDPDFYIIARTDAHASEGQAAAIARAKAYVEAGADAIFAEAVHTLKEYKEFTDAMTVPVLANITEFGATPLFTTEELASVGIAMVLYPLSAFRAMNKAALNVYQELKDKGTQEGVISTMQTRMELYDMLNYHAYGFFIGGAMVYHQTYPMVDELYLTMVHADFEADTFFPSINYSDWDQVSYELHQTDSEKSIRYSFEHYIRK